MVYKTLAFLFAFLAGVAVCHAASAPYQSMAEVHRDVIDSSQPIADVCPGTPNTGGAFKLKHGDKQYLLFYIGRDGSEVTRVVLMDTADGDNTPVWLGTVRKGAVSFEDSITHVQFKALYPTLCDVLNIQEF